MEFAAELADMMSEDVLSYVSPISTNQVRNRLDATKGLTVGVFCCGCTTVPQVAEKRDERQGYPEQGSHSEHVL